MILLTKFYDIQHIFDKLFCLQINFPMIDVGVWFDKHCKLDFVCPKLRYYVNIYTAIF